MSVFSRIREDVPFVQVDSQGRITGASNFKDNGKFNSYIESIRTGSISAPAEISTHPQGTAAGNLSGAEGYDLVAINLTAGVTYSFDYRGTEAGGIEDPYLALFGPGFTYITEDDDGGAGRGSLITYTPTASGTHYLYLTSWYTLAYGDPSIDTGNYAVNVWNNSDPTHDAGGTIATSVAIGPGTSYGMLNVAGDVDVYAITMTEGMVYTFGYAGGISGGSDWDDEPGENIGRIQVLDAGGNVLASNVNYESAISFFAASGGTYYLRVSGYDSPTDAWPDMTGGYTLDVRELDPADYDPLDSIDWQNASTIPTVDVDGVPTAYVYFAPAGENFGETADDGVTPMTTYGWNQKEMDAVMLALEQYSSITGINYEVTTDVTQATFRLLTTTSTQYGAYFYPQDPVYGTQQGIGVFNVNSGGWDKPGVSSQNIPGDQVSLDQGGFAFGVILHEFGHGHGLAHPHDTGGGSEIMLGVNGSASYGVYNLNQGVYTVMSYNDAWDFHPDGPSAYTLNGIDNGWSGTLGAFDVAQLQARYGVYAANTGDSVYALTDVADEAYYQTIWDSAGNDTISYGGTLNAQIDLTAATLDYSPTGGGVISFLYNASPTTTGPEGNNSFQVRGGYTIANGVEIENATGGSGNDVLLGNAIANVLTGNGGNDTLLGRAGNDSVIGGDGLDVATLGDGDDFFLAEVTATKQVLKTGSMSVDIITDFDAAGNDTIDLSGLGVAFNFRGTSANKNAGDLTYKTYDSVNGAENALGFDIDGRPGAGGISGPVTVVYGNLDGGKADFAIILLNTSSVDASDFEFGDPVSATAAGGGRYEPDNFFY